MSVVPKARSNDQNPVDPGESSRPPQDRPAGPVKIRRAAEILLLVNLYAIELAVLALAIAVPRIGSQSLYTVVTTRAGRISLLALMALALAVTAVIRLYRNHARSRPSFAAVVALNLFTLVMFLTVGEAAIRLLSSRTPEGEIVAAIRLLPRRWSDEAVYRRRIAAQAATSNSLLVYDPLMGWTVGPSRTSIDGRSFSSREGIRSPVPGMTFADGAAGRRVALVGDSFTFCLDVPYEDSWGHQLERRLGADVRVLNFGVTGYGIDQAYLRYRRDVRPWRPDVVVFGVFPHDLFRTMTVYPFIAFRGWEFPFSKPRFVERDGELALLNEPPLAPDVMFAARSIAELPFIEYDRGYVPTDWDWYPYQSSYLLRLARSALPAASPLRELVSDEAMGRVNAEILRAFLRDARANGVRPLVVYLPARAEIGPGPSEEASFARRLLTDASIEHVDLTECLLKVPASDQFVPGLHHYSPTANAAVANCLASSVAKLLSGGGG